MIELTIEKVEIIKDQIEESVSCGNMYPNVARTLIDMLNEAISVTRCSLQLPDDLEPVLAKIQHVNDLGKSSWYEVVYNDGNWRSYKGSNTFEDGEKVVKWKYCKAIV